MISVKKVTKISRKVLLDPDYRFLIWSNIRPYKRMLDEDYLAKKYEIIFGKTLNLEAPSTFNEKLQWLKLYDRKLDYTTMADKYASRNYVAKKIGDQYLVPLLGAWDTALEINFSLLPNKFVLKCNHNSGLGMCICTDKTSLNITGVKIKLACGMKQDYFFHGREWPYKDIPRKIIAEEYLGDESGLTDYKVHNFNGEPKLILVCQDRFTKSGLTEDFFSENWEHLDIKRPNHPNAKKTIEKPEELGEVLRLSRILSKGVPFLRTDFYIVNHKIYFSELTFYPSSGFEKFVPEKWDSILGDWLQLPEKNKKLSIEKR